MTTSEGFSAAEREAMRQRAEELRAERGGRTKADGLQAVFDALGQMPQADPAIAERVRAIVTRIAPHLLARTWYGMPAYREGKEIVCFFQGAARFEARDATLGFNDAARLDDRDMWPVAVAITAWTDAVEGRVEDLLRRAIDRAWRRPVRPGNADPARLRPLARRGAGCPVGSCRSSPR